MAKINFRLNLNRKLVSIVIVVLVVYSAIVVIANSSLVDRALMKERLGRIEIMLELLFHQAEDYFTQMHDGVIDPLTAQYYVTEMTSKMKYGDAGYFWIQNYDCKLIVKGKDVYKDVSTAGEVKGALDYELSKNVSEVRSGDGIRYYDVISNRVKNGSLQGSLTIREAGEKRLIMYRAFPEWKWIFATSIEIESINEYISSIIKKQIGLVFGLWVLVVGLFIVIINRLLVNPLLEIRNVTREIIRGNYKKIPAMNRKDEVGEVGNSINEMVDAIENGQKKTDKLINETYRVAEKIKDSSENLSNITGDLLTFSNEMADTSENLKTNTNQATENSQEVSANTVSISNITDKSARSVSEMADGMRDVSENFNTQVAAIEQMNASISQITENTEEGRSIAADAIKKAKKSIDVMKRMSDVSMNIGKIVKIIDDVASRTNMLALNASIEAASAGAAGKGFAVVALEVKELAKKSAESTKDITLQIEDSQKIAIEAASSIDDVSGIIERMNEITQTIAQSMSEQAVVAGDILKSITLSSKHADSVSKNAEQTKDGVKGIAHNTQESSKTMLNISQSIFEVDKLGKNVFTVSSGILSRSKDLEKEVESLNSLIADLKVLEKLRTT